MISVRRKHRLLFAATMTVGPLGAFTAAAPISFAGGTYSQNFSSLPIQVATFNAAGSGSFATGTAASATPTGTFSFSTLSQPFDFDASNTAGGLGLSQMAGFYGGSGGTGGQFGAHNGGTTTGGVIDFGANAGTAGASSRFLGLLNTSTTATNSYFGLGLINSTGSNISSFNLNFTAALWRQSTIAKTLYFGYEVLPAGSTEPNFGASTSALTSIGSVNFGTSSTASGGVAIDGTLAANQLSVNNSVSIPGGIAAGSDLFLTWYFNDSTGKAQGIGIGSLNFSSTLSGNGGGGGAQIDTWNIGVGSGAWDTATQNWTAAGSLTKYSDGDSVVFPDTLNSGNGTINITAASVSPAAMTVSNSNGTYTILGNPINGSGALTKNGAGTLVLSPTTTNGYTGGTNVNGGQLIIAADPALGAASGAINFNGGSLITSTALTSIRSISLTGAGTIDTRSNSATFATVAGTGPFTKAGTGSLTFTGNFASGPLSVQAGSLIFSGGINSGGGTISINPGTAGSLNGSLVLTSNADLSVNTGSLSGTGSILVQGSGSAVTNGKAQSATIGSKIVLNSTNPSGTGFTRGDVTQSPFAVSNFTTVIGGTTAGTGSLTVAGTISGYSDVVISNDPKTGGGSGALILNQPNTYHGTTVINTNAATIISGATNALPSDTDVIIGGSNSGVDNLIGNLNGGTIGLSTFDLAGHNQQIATLSDGDNYGVGTGIGALTITNTGVNATFAVSGSRTPANGFSGGSIAGSINLVKGGSNTLVLNNTSTYTGSTTVRGGTLSIGSSQSSQLSLTESISSPKIILQGIDSHAALALYSSGALGTNSTTDTIAVITGGSGVEIDLNYSGQITVFALSVNGVNIPNGVYSTSNEPAADPTLFGGGGGTFSVVPEPMSIVTLLAVTPMTIGRRRRRVRLSLRV